MTEKKRHERHYYICQYNCIAVVLIIMTKKMRIIEAIISHGLAYEHAAKVIIIWLYGENRDILISIFF